MKSKEEKEESKVKLSEPQQNVLKGAQSDIEYFLGHHQQVSEEGVNHLRGVVQTLNTFLESYTKTYIYLLKQGYEED